MADRMNSRSHILKTGKINDSAPENKRLPLAQSSGGAVGHCCSWTLYLPWEHAAGSRINWQPGWLPPRGGGALPSVPVRAASCRQQIQCSFAPVFRGRNLRACCPNHFGDGGARLSQPQHVGRPPNPWNFVAHLLSGLLRMGHPRSVPFGQHALDTATERRTPIRQGSQGIARSRRFGDRRSAFRDAA
jgi:hypothetical protein